MDATDHRLLDHLEADARASVTALAEKLKLARSTVQDRIARLERSGEIRGYTIRRADPRAARLIRAHVMLSVDPKLSDRVVADLKALPELKRLVTISGEFDLIAELAAETTDGSTRCLIISAPPRRRPHHVLHRPHREGER